VLNQCELDVYSTRWLAVPAVTAMVTTTLWCSFNQAHKKLNIEMHQISTRYAIETGGPTSMLSNDNTLDCPRFIPQLTTWPCSHHICNVWYIVLTQYPVTMVMSEAEKNSPIQTIFIFCSSVMKGFIWVNVEFRVLGSKSGAKWSTQEFLGPYPSEMGCKIKEVGGRATLSKSLIPWHMQSWIG
jgi:hypothetical protein